MKSGLISLQNSLWVETIIKKKLENDLLDSKDKVVDGADNFF